METTTTIPSWMDQIQAEITEMESDWRQLDEQEWRTQDPAMLAHVTRAKQVKEAEAGRLVAERAVASFVEEFYARGQTEIGESLVAQMDEKSWTAPTLTREEFARFVRAERVALPGLEMRWGSPTSTGDRTTGGWWIELDAVCFLSGEELSRRRYRFHVVDEHVDAWMALTEGHPAWSCSRGEG